MGFNIGDDPVFAAMRFVQRVPDFAVLQSNVAEWILSQVIMEGDSNSSGLNGVVARTTTMERQNPNGYNDDDDDGGGGGGGGNSKEGKKVEFRRRRAGANDFDDED